MKKCSTALLEFDDGSVKIIKLKIKNKIESFVV